MVAAVLAGLRAGSPAVACEACACVQALAAVAGLGLQPVAQGLLETLLPLLRARQQTVGSRADPLLAGHHLSAVRGGGHASWTEVCVRRWEHVEERRQVVCTGRLCQDALSVDMLCLLW